MSILEFPKHPTGLSDLKKRKLDIETQLAILTQETNEYAREFHNLQKHAWKLANKYHENLAYCNLLLQQRNELSQSIERGMSGDPIQQPASSLICIQHKLEF